LLSSTMETKIGNGFDVHAFDDANATHIRLCGVDIPHVRKLKGHSDADVGLHAITDAIFGALADGDIGSHFPPSDMTFKDMDSHVFLDKAIERSHARGGQINHIDVTFMCEEPKIGKHRDLIRNHLSDYLKLPLSRISVKATTTERLGFTGRGEGIACQAIVTIQVPTNE
jgi:2-C-methyl-D-erythritol 4-phosphate cytidylyltransferase/2-C-methyl-D-erythritol 2,4-cyclodiphosphate synthase